MNLLPSKENMKELRNKTHIISQKVDITDKEAYLIWAIICWFSGLVTSSLKYKLYSLMNEKKRIKMGKMYDKEIMKRIVYLGEFITSKHPEWLK